MISFANSVFMQGCHLIAVPEKEEVSSEMNKQNFSRSSRLEVFCKKDVPRNFSKFTGKHLCQILFINLHASALQLY